MTLENLQKEMIQSMKNGDKIRKETLSSMVSAVKKAAIDQKCKDNISESLIDQVLLKEQKTMQEMIDTCPAERAETLAMYKQKMEIIKEFAPTLLNDPVEIEREVRDIAYELNIALEKKNTGVVMKTIMPQFKGKADMGMVSRVIKGMLV
jgi:hypothetical protein